MIGRFDERRVVIGVICDYVTSVIGRDAAHCKMVVCCSSIMDYGGTLVKNGSIQKIKIPKLS